MQFTFLLALEIPEYQILQILFLFYHKPLWDANPTFKGQSAVSKVHDAEVAPIGGASDPKNRNYSEIEWRCQSEKKFVCIFVRVL